VIDAIIGFKRLPADEKKMFFIAIFLVIKVKILTSLFPLRFYSSSLGVQHKSILQTMDGQELTPLYKVLRTLKRTSSYLPFKNKCLVDAIVAKKMLKKLGLGSTLYLGVGRESEKKIVAHAWLKCNGTIVAGERGMERFVAVEWFS
jgi:hypothetical protein